MKRPIRVLLALLTGIAAAFTAAAPAQADVQDFYYDSWHVEYDVGVQADGRAIAHVTETIVAHFPDYDQNRGIVLGKPIKYQGATTDPRDFSVTDEHGDPVPFWTESEDGFIAVLTGTNDYLHGAQTFVISYALSDVVLARDDGSADEFYWQLIDVEHLQRIEHFSAEIRFDSTLTMQLNGDSRCYIGDASSSTPCEFESTDDAFTVSPVALGPYEGASVAIGLLPGSVVQPSVRLPNFMLDELPLYIGALTLGTGIASSAVAAKMKRRRREHRGVIVAQYDVPANLPPLIAAPIAELKTDPIAAQYVHLAVNGAARLEETDKKGNLPSPDKPLKRKSARPAIRLLDPTKTADPLDKAVLDVLFPNQVAGELFKVPKKDEGFVTQMNELTSEGREHAVKRGYLETARSPLARWLGWVALILAVVLTVFTLIGFATRDSITPVIMMIGIISTVLLVLRAMSKHTVHTVLGAETREYLLGVRKFIEVAEEDRIRVLQSYSGAERHSGNTADVIHLYEKLLPYAMIFGLEKEWGEVLQTAYEQGSEGQSPAWYPLAVSRGFAQMSSNLSHFTSSLTSSASYSSSSSGGSSGGGSVGGGGGGGFSGGR